MKSRTLFVMLGLVGLAALAIILTEGPESAPEAPNPLRAVDFASLDRIESSRRDGDDWILERAGDRWRLTSASVAGGNPVPASREVTEKLIGALRDCEPQSRFVVDDETLGSYDLAPPRLRLRLRDAGGTKELEIGGPRIDDFVGFREKGAATGFRVHVSIFDDFARHPSWYRDPRLLNVRFAEVEELTLTNEQGSRALRREAGRWFLVGPQGAMQPGDSNLCDRFVAGVLSLAGPPCELDDDRAKTAEGLRHVDIVARSRDGRESKGRIHLVDDSRQEVLMSRPDDPMMRVAGRVAWRVMSRDFDSLRSLKVFQVGRNELATITVEADGRSPLRFRKGPAGAWYVRPTQGPSDPKVDQERFDAFADRLLNLRMVPKTTDEAAVSDVRWTVTLGFPTDVSSPPISLKIASPGESGDAVAKRSDQRATIRLEPVDLTFLDGGWWQFAQRFVTSSNEADITEIAIVDAKETGEGELKVIKGTDPDGEDLWLAGERPVPAEFIRPLIGRLSFLAVDDFLGPIEAHPRFAAKEARFQLRWRLPTADSVSRDWLSWKVIDRYDDERWVCSVDHFPGLLFLIRGEDLLVVENALRGMRRS